MGEEGDAGRGKVAGEKQNGFNRDVAQFLR